MRSSDPLPPPSDDPVFTTFLERQLVEGRALAADSDVLELSPVEVGPAPRRYAARFRLPVLVRAPGGEVTRSAGGALVGVSFHADYLRRIDPARLVTWLAPQAAVHPNVRAPFVCLGRLRPGTPLVELLSQVHELVTFQKFSTADGLDPDACQWVRNHLDELPLSRGGLRRRRLSLSIRPRPPASAAPGEPTP